VAFERKGAGRTGLFVIPMSGGEPTQIGAWASGVMGGLTWTPDGTEVLFARPELSGRRLLRARADGRTPATPVTAAPHGAIGPSVSQYRTGGAYRLALMTGQPDVGLRLIGLQAAQQRAGAPPAGDVPFSDATRMDVPGRFSSDGSHVAFVSDRGGSQQVWVAQRDGSDLRSITELEDATVNVGAWSPDGASVLFDATIDGNTDLYIVRADGGSPRRLTASGAAEFDGEWSRDGAWIYYVSEQSGSPFIRRMPSGGGASVQITPEPGFEPRESPDGRTIFFIDKRRDYGLGPGATLKRVSVDGGPVSVVHSGVMAGAWEVTDSGILFLQPRVLFDGSPQPDAVMSYDVASHQVRRLGELAFRVAPFGTTRYFIASRDGRWALASHVDGWERDIIVIDNFR